MDEREFRRLLNLFPVVRSRSYCQAEAASSSGTTSSITEEKRENRPSLNPNLSLLQQIKDMENDGEIDAEEPFWQKLKTAAERKVGPNKAEQFVKAFRDAHETLVYNKLSVDAAQSFIDTARK